MRREMERILKEEFRILAIRTRNRLGITQKEMGRRLFMSESSYSDIETGKSACGALSEALLLEMQCDPKEFLKKLMEKLKK